MKFHKPTYWGVYDADRYGEKHAKYILISCGYMLFLKICNSVVKNGGDGFSMYFDGHIYHVIMQKYLPLLCIVFVYT